MLIKIVSVLLFALLSVSVSAKLGTPFQEVAKDPELSLFKQIILANPKLMGAFRSDRTLRNAFLAPTNQAVKNFFYAYGLAPTATTFRNAAAMKAFMQVVTLNSVVNFKRIPIPTAANIIKFKKAPATQKFCLPFRAGPSKIYACRSKTALTFESSVTVSNVEYITYPNKVFKVSVTPLQKCESIYTFAKSKGFTKFAAAIDMVPAATAQPFKFGFAGTAFIPSNTAIDAFVNFAGTPTAAEWADILLYHLSPNKYTSAFIAAAKNVTAPTLLSKATLTFINGEIEDLGYSATTLTAIKDVALCGSGVAHGIGGVLLSE